MANERPLEQDQPGDDGNLKLNFIETAQDWFSSLMPDLSWLNPWSDSEESQQAASSVSADVELFTERYMANSNGLFQVQYRSYIEASSEQPKTVITVQGHPVVNKSDLMTETEFKNASELGIVINTSFGEGVVHYIITGVPTLEQINFVQGKISEFVAGDTQLETFYSENIASTLPQLPKNVQDRYNANCAENPKHCPQQSSSLIEDEKTGQHMPLDTPKLAQGASAFQAI